MVELLFQGQLCTCEYDCSWMRWKDGTFNYRKSGEGISYGGRMGRKGRVALKEMDGKNQYTFPCKTRFSPFSCPGNGVRTNTYSQSYIYVMIIMICPINFCPIKQSTIISKMYKSLWLNTMELKLLSICAMVPLARKW